MSAGGAMDGDKEQQVVQALEEITNSLQSLQEKCNSLDSSYTKFHSQQTSCSSELKKQKKYIKRVQKLYADDDRVQKASSKSLETVKNIADHLPKPNNFYLSLIVGSRLNVVLPGRKARLEYKHAYEDFKLKTNGIMLAISAFLLYLHFTFHDESHPISTAYRTSVRMNCFFFLWYYCTLTVRESILIVNGSKIKGWYMAHHYLSIITSGIVVTIPDGTCDYLVVQYLSYSAYNNLVSLLQFSYQKSALYGMKAVGRRETEMDITTDAGITVVMAKFVSLKVILPFLFFGYGYQFFIGTHLLKLYVNDDTDHGSQSWQVLAIAILFLILFSGNMITMSQVLHRKLTSSKKKSQ